RQRLGGERGTAPEARNIDIAIAAPLDQASGLLFTEALDLTQTQAKGEGFAGPAGTVKIALALLMRVNRSLHGKGSCKSGIRAGNLQRAVPVAVVDVRRAGLDAVFYCIAHDLGRGVKAHGLTIEKSAGEYCRIVAFHPGRDIGELGKARRM